jgi:hypothetical protein
MLRDGDGPMRNIGPEPVEFHNIDAESLKYDLDLEVVDGPAAPQPKPPAPRPTTQAPAPQKEPPGNAPTGPSAPTKDERKAPSNHPDAIIHEERKAKGGR